MNPITKRDVSLISDSGLEVIDNNVDYYPPEEGQHIFCTRGVQDILRDSGLDEISVTERYFEEQRRAAAALAKMLKAFGGLNNLSGLASRDREEIAAKVEAIQQQVLNCTHGVYLFDKPFSATPTITEKPQFIPEIFNRGNSHSYSSPESDGHSSKTSPFDHGAMNEKPIQNNASHESLHLAKNFNLSCPTRNATFCASGRNDILAYESNGAFKKSAGKQLISAPGTKTAAEIKSSETLATDPGSTETVSKIANHITQETNFMPEKVNSCFSGQSVTSTADDASTRLSVCLKRAHERRNQSLSCSSSVEYRVWKSRRVWSDASVEVASQDDKLQNSNLKYPVWCGNSFMRGVSSSERDPDFYHCLLPVSPWWTRIFEDNTEAAIDQADAINKDVLAAVASVDNDTQVVSQDSNILKYHNEPLVNGYELLERLYPPPVRDWPLGSHNFDSTFSSSNFQFVKYMEVKDRFLEEILRGKMYLLSDFDRPIPQCILDKIPLKHAGPYEDHANSYSFTDKKPSPDWRSGSREPEEVTEPCIRRSRREGLRTRNTARVTAASDPAPPGLRASPPGNQSTSAALRSGSPVKQAPNTAAIDAPKSRGNSSKTTSPLSPITESEFDVIKKASGWHPYVWYLMCRRPELYGIGIRARVVARVAGWEWDEIQRIPELLHCFLERIFNFVEKNPVPRSADKKEAKEYKNFAANSVRTPWYQMETPAVKRALKDLETETLPENVHTVCGIDSDSGPSDTGSNGQPVLNPNGMVYPQDLPVLNKLPILAGSSNFVEAYSVLTEKSKESSPSNQNKTPATYSLLNHIMEEPVNNQVYPIA